MIQVSDRAQNYIINLCKNLDINNLILEYENRVYFLSLNKDNLKNMKKIKIMDIEIFYEDIDAFCDIYIDCGDDDLFGQYLTFNKIK